MEFPLGMLLGFVLGVFASLLMALLILKPEVHAAQFKQDCVSMAHGTVSKDSPRICRKGNTILFTAK